jgi:N-formylglutamate deformylase
MDAVHVPGVLKFTPPQTTPVPLVFDSPHSGSHYPDDFRSILGDLDLRRLEDAFVDDLYDHVPGQGAALLAAQFPRSYIDPNRAADDLDVSMLAEPWPDESRPSQKTRSGIGLVFRNAPNGPLYNRKLSVAEVRRRLERFYWPYHNILKQALDQTWQRHGVVLHINCHSMRTPDALLPSVGHRQADHNHACADAVDFILGDRDGRSCSPRITAAVAGHLRDQGFNVAINNPFKGVELVSRYSDPSDGRHSLQIELSRGLYMHERRVEKHERFTGFKAVLQSLTGALASFVGEETGRS